MSRHELLSTIDELVSPDVLAGAIAAPVEEIATVERERISSSFAHSGSELHRITVWSRSGAHRFIVKRLAAEWDWLMQVTSDDRCRSVALWQCGILDDLPESIDTTVVACSRDEYGWAILMRDADAALVTNTRFTEHQNDRFVEAMADMHARFWEDSRLRDGEYGLCGLDDVYRMFAPATARRYAHLGRDIHNHIREGWRAVGEVMPTDVAETVLTLVEDPEPLVGALGRFPHTLVHGDFRHSNVGLSTPTPEPVAGGRRPERSGNGLFGHRLPERTERTVLLDWQLAVFAPPSVELGRYIGANSPFLPTPKDQLLEGYRAALERRLRAGAADAEPLPAVERSWEAQLRLGLLGGFIQDGWAIALKATTWDIAAATRATWRADLEWWAEQVRLGRRYL